MDNLNSGASDGADFLNEPDMDPALVAELRRMKRPQAQRKYAQSAKGKAAAKRAVRVTATTPDVKARRNARARERRSEKKAAGFLSRPFIGVDGEGCGTDEHGRQCYMLLQAGDQSCFTGEPLTTVDCLEFLLDALPADGIAVGFSFGYDVTMILRDVPENRLADILRDRDNDAMIAPDGTSTRRNPYTWWHGYGIDYLPRKYFRVCRAEKVIRHKADGEYVTWRAVKGTSRTVQETFGFFQSSFLATIQKFAIGTDTERELIKRNKEARSSFEAITDEVRTYCAMECRMLADLMAKFRENCLGANIKLDRWQGAGEISAYLHKANNTIRRDEVDKLVPAKALEYASRAYYGGRFEVTRVGAINQRVYCYDINSAYPHAMTQLPCLRCGTWHAIDKAWLANAPGNALYVADVHFVHHPKATLCGLPIRQGNKHGKAICWPIEGNGVYWSVELRSAEELGARISYRDGWRYEPNPACSCQPFAWLPELYEARKRLGKDGPGYPIKLGINGAYGKTAQRKGARTFYNSIYASLITAKTRAMLNLACAQKPNAVVMLATDGVFSLEPLDLPVGSALGQWEAKELDRLFVVQPGLYWSTSGGSDPKTRTRGISPKFFDPHLSRFEKEWSGFRDGGDVPSVSVPLTLFTGLRLAHSRGKPLTAGVWAETERAYSFQWFNKRDVECWFLGSHIRTFPKRGSRFLVSERHSGDLAFEQAAELDRLMLEDQHDYITLRPEED